MPPVQQRLPAETGEETGGSAFSKFLSSWPPFRWPGRRQKAGDMVKPQGLGAPMPVNTLSNTNGTSTRTPHGISSTFRATASGPSPAKRQKLEEPSTTLSHCHATFALVETPKPRGRSIGSVSVAGSQRSLASSTSTSQQVYRSVDHITKRKRPRRSRSGPRFMGQEEEFMRISASKSSPGLVHNDDISDDEVDLINPREVLTGSPQPKRKRLEERPILEIADRFKENAPPGPSEGQQVFSRVLDNVEKKMRRDTSDMSPDELAPSLEEITASRPAKRSRQFSSSLSKRGDILPSFKGVASTTKTSTTSSEFSKAVKQQQKAKLIIGTGLRILRGTSGQCQYQSGYKDDPDPCFLSVREIGHTLFPVDQSNELLKAYRYLTLDLNAARSILWAQSDKTCWIAVVNYSKVNLKNSAGAKLMIELASAQELDKFLEWANIYREGGYEFDFKDCNRDKLEREFIEATQRAKSHTVITDADEMRPVADDIRVIQHNHDNRVSETQIVRHLVPESRVGPKWKNAMTVSPTEPNGSGIALSQPRGGQLASARRQLRTTQSTFAYIGSPESCEPEPEAWTSLNAGWEKQWRNSLVYPDSGKNRATVDKDDIQRLDEGQFLNDNIIIFYLRYLQKNLEDNNKDLAKRIYFQNTFFYDKLKPTKAGQGINYDSVKTWTSKVDLFSKDYIIVPINEYTHWYVAIICNAPKLLPPLDSHEQAEGIGARVNFVPNDSKITQGASEAFPPKEHSTGYIESEAVKPAQQDVVENFRRMSIDSSSYPSDEIKQTAENNAGDEVDSIPTIYDDGVYVIKDSDGPDAVVEDAATAAIPQTRKKTGKRLSAGLRKTDPNQPRIITLDSLGAPHSPTCSYLKQYLVAELKDKRGIEIPPPGAMGTTAKDVPEQTNHCDCGLYLLGYIQQFLQDPDNFVKSLLQRDGGISWHLDPSELRKHIRDLIFSLQKEQQKTEDLARERKLRAKMNRPQTRGQGTSSHMIVPATRTRTPSKMEPTAQYYHLNKASGSKSSPPPVKSQPPSPRGSPITPATAMSPKPTSGKSAEHAATKVRLPQDSIHSNVSVTTRQEEIKNPSDVQEVQARPKADSNMVASPRKTETIFNHRTHQIYDTVLVSPAKDEAAGCHSSSPETEASTEIRRGFLPPLVSESTSSKSSRGATPLDPVVVDDSDNNQRGRARYSPEMYKESQTGNQLITAIPSVHTKSQSPGQDGKTKSQKRTGPESPYFTNRQDGERMTAAKLRENTLNDIIDLSDD